jgi:hypothetical protein
MKGMRSMQEQRVVLYAALLTYLEELFIEKDRTHYASKRWWRAILLGYPMLSAIAILLFYLYYFMLRKNSEYDLYIMKVLLSIPVGYVVFMVLIGNSFFVKRYKERTLEDAPFYLRAYFLHSAVEFAYLRCINNLLSLKDLEEGRVKKEKRKLLCRAVRAPFWPTEAKKPWELRMSKPNLWQKVKNVFYEIVDANGPLPLRWSEEEVLNDYKRLPTQDKIYLMSSLRQVMAIFNADYFEHRRREIFSMSTIELTEEKNSDRMLRKLYGPFGKGVLSISDYFSLFPSVEHAYAAFYHVLRQTWTKMHIRAICAGHSPVMALLILTDDNYHRTKATI